MAEQGGIILTLNELLNGVEHEGYVFDQQIKYISCDSRKVPSDSLFICIKGENFDGHDKVMDVISKGVVAVVCERDLGIKSQILVSDTRVAYAKICANYFNNPSANLNMIGVTGTKGKTTITKVVKSILEKNKLKSGLVGTIQSEIDTRVYSADKTTPDAYELQSLFSEMTAKNCEYCVMEVSSHAIEQSRVGSVHFSIGVFTNLAHEHLDYHDSMENYYNAKKKLFDHTDLAIINIDDEYGRRLLSEVKCKTVTYSVENPEADYYTENIKHINSKVEFTLVDTNKNNSGKVKFNMPGTFSAQNAIAAAAVCLNLDIPFNKIVNSLNNFTGVKGRCEVIPTEKDFTVICDFAHTPGSLENILSALKEQCEGRLVALFGCGGDRDKAKRPLMGKAAAKYADFLIITSDNPRTENPDDIINDILTGIDKDNVKYITIPNRREAIHYAIDNAQPKDMIVLAGKGHEDYQIIGHEKNHFDEREIVTQAIEMMK